jgi:hypothetical protein
MLSPKPAPDHDQRWRKCRQGRLNAKGIAMLLFILFLSVPPADPPATVVNTRTVEFDKIDWRSADRMAGNEATFHVVLASASDTWFGCRCFEVEMRRGMCGTIWLEPGEDDDDADELVITGRITIIRQTDMKGLPFLEYRIWATRIVVRK